MQSTPPDVTGPRPSTSIETGRGASTASSPGVAAPRSGAELFLRRKDIDFCSDTTGEVIIRLTIRNRGNEASAPTTARIQSAPLGAFVDWRPLKVVPVPSVPARGSVVVETRSWPEPPTPLGMPGRIFPPDGGLRTTVAPEDDRTPGRHAGRGSDPGDATAGLIAAFLAPDVLAEEGYGGVHWAGNLNVFIGSTPVERHMARAIRVQPGRTNLAAFFVGSGPDAYRFEFRGAGVRWNPRLSEVELDVRALESADPSVSPWSTGEWHRIERRAIARIAFHPEPGDAAGSLDVLVEQESTGNVARVEFGFDPEALGPGCYVVE